MWSSKALLYEYLLFLGLGEVNLDDRESSPSQALNVAVSVSKSHSPQNSTGVGVAVIGGEAIRGLL